ncbi:DUF924 family protein, partial [Pontivivens nitratireducens]|uniref:DUF924 family protein n=1 Tax=Pontivivens nitratireducens TaxID=2758038 RepID=UPI0016396B6D
MNETIESVLQYWLKEVGQEKWYEQDAALDADITSRFESTWQQAANGELIHWMRSSRGTLALLIVTDQFGSVLTSVYLARSMRFQILKRRSARR